MQVKLVGGYEPHEHQLRVHQSNARFKVMVCGTRGGKTIAAVAEFLTRIYADLNNPNKPKMQVAGSGRFKSPRLRYWLTAPTYQLVREAFYYLQRFIPKELIERTYEDRIWLVPDILIELRTASRPDELQGAGIDGALVDEAARINEQSWVGGLSARLTDRPLSFCVFSTTPTGKNWFYHGPWKFGTTGGDRKLTGWESFSWRTIDNPHIDRAEVERKRLELPEQWHRRDFEASFDSFIGTVYSEFDPAIHVVDEASFRAKYNWFNRPLKDLFETRICGVDWGWNDPSALIVIGKLRDQYFVLDEEYGSHLRLVDADDPKDTLVGKASELRKKWGIERFEVDPSRPENAAEFNRVGLNVHGAKNDVAWGIKKVVEALHPVNGRPRLLIFSHCKNLLRELPSYEWNTKTGSDDLEDKPADGQSDHALDALRYGMVSMLKFAPIAVPAGHNPYLFSHARPIG